MENTTTHQKVLPHKTLAEKIKGFAFYLLEDPNSKPRDVLNIFMILVVIASVLGMILEVDPARTEKERIMLGYFENFFIVFFVTEYILRFWVCSNFKKDYKAAFLDYTRTHHRPHRRTAVWFGLRQAISHKVRWMRQPLSIVDLLAILPLFRVFRIFRVLRILRALKLFRYSRRLSFFTNILKGCSYELVSLSIVAAVVWGMVALAFFMAERADNPKITSTWEAIYWAIVTITTVGYGDISPVTPMGRSIAVVGTLFGMWVTVFITSVVVSALTNNIVNLQEIRMETKVAQLKDHLIVCGLDVLGQAVCHTLKHENKPFVAVDKDHSRVENARKKGWLAIRGDVTEAEVWGILGLPQAHSVICSITTESTNVYVILMVRELRPECFIVACGDSHASEKRLQRVGANRVVFPAHIGGRKLVSSALRPSATQLIDTLLRRENIEIELEEITILKGSILQDKPLESIYIRRDFRGILIVGYVTQDGHTHDTPKGDQILHAGDTLVCLGNRDTLKRTRKMLQSKAFSLADSTTMDL